jgi:hypothetical protein
LALTATAAAALGAGGALIPTSSDAAFVRLRSVLWAMSTACPGAFTGVLVAGVGDFNVTSAVTLAAGAACGYAVVLWLRTRAAVQQLAMFAAAAVTVGAGIARADPALRAWGPGLGVWALSALWVVAAHRGYLGAPNPGYAAAGIGLLTGAQMAMQVAAGHVHAIATVAAPLTAGVVLRRVWLLAAGAIAVIQVVPQTAVRYLPESAAAPLAAFVPALRCSPRRSAIPDGGRRRDPTTARPAVPASRQLSGRLSGLEELVPSWSSRPRGCTRSPAWARPTSSPLRELSEMLPGLVHGPIVPIARMAEQDESELDEGPGQSPRGRGAARTHGGKAPAGLEDCPRRLEQVVSLEDDGRVVANDDPVDRDAHDPFGVDAGEQPYVLPAGTFHLALRAREQVRVVLDGGHQPVGSHGAHEPGEVVTGPAGDVADAVAAPDLEQPDGAFEVPSAGDSDEPVRHTGAHAAIGTGGVFGLHLVPSTA